MKKQTSPRIVRRETPPKMTGRDGYRKAEPHLRRDFDCRWMEIAVLFFHLLSANNLVLCSPTHIYKNCAIASDSDH